MHCVLLQVQLLGKKVTTLIHPSDIPELKKQFNLKPCEMHCSCPVNTDNNGKASTVDICRYCVIHGCCKLGS